MAQLSTFSMIFKEIFMEDLQVFKYENNDVRTVKMNGERGL